MTPYFFIQGMKKGSNLTTKNAHRKEYLERFDKVDEEGRNILMAEDLGDILMRQ